MRVGAALTESLAIHGLARGGEAQRRVADTLDAVGMPRGSVNRFPHEFSGGQRQRIAIARALVVSPELLICDEPVSALDVSVRAQIVNLLADLQEELQLAVLFIAHDLAVVRQMATRIAVMYLGEIVEVGPADHVCAMPLHPYTQSLISAVPSADPVYERSRERIVLKGDIPSALDPPRGCRFHTRCPYARELCRTTPPPLERATAGRTVACHFWSELSAPGQPLVERTP
jgi:oligopeptide/dipeptide ABC transporter ATP-binding protein